MLKMRAKTILATLLVLLLAVSCVVGVFPFLVGAAQSVTGKELTSAYAGAELTEPYYYVKENTSLTLKGGSAKSALKVKSGSTVTIYIPQGSTLTVIGGAASTTSGGGAGIEVPSSSTLKVIGGGTLVATGGAGASGGNGGNGETAVWGDDDYTYIPDSGYGGYGGGGAGAGIGTKGGNGGASTSWRTAFTYYRRVWTDYFMDNNYSGNLAYNGYNGKSADACGTVYIASTVSYTATGGAEGAKGGTGGSAGSRDYESDDHDMRGLAGGSGGGGGGAGKSGAGIGTGGGGGGGGASGGGIGYAWSCYFLGAGGGGGGAGAKGGTGGAWSSDSSIPDHDCSKYFGGKEQSSWSGLTGGLNEGGNGGTGCKIQIRRTKSTSASWEYPWGASGGKGGSAGEASVSKNVLTLLPITVVEDGVSTLHYAYGTQFLPDTLAVGVQVGYTFEGYYGDDGLQYYDANGVRTSQVVSAATGTIQARFEINNYYYSVAPTEGSNTQTTENTSVQYGSAITLQTPTREGYLFRGWKITAAGENSRLNGDAYYSYTPAASTYSMRGAVGTLSYSNDGKVAQTAGFETIGESITLYNLSAEDNGEVVIEELWMVNSFTVTFRNFDGQTISTITGERDQALVSPSLPQNLSEYYTYTFKYWKCNIDNSYYDADDLPLFGAFIGYEGELGEEMVREGVIFTAVYDITYKKHFELTGTLGPNNDLDMTDPQFPNGVLVLKSGDTGVPVVTNFKITKNDGVSTLLLIPKYDASAFTIKAISVNGTCVWVQGSAESTSVLDGFDVTVTGNESQSDVLKILLDHLNVDNTTANEVFIQIVYEMKEAIGGRYEFGFVTAPQPVDTDSITHGDRSEAYGFYDPDLDSETNPFAFNELLITVDSTAINVVIRATGAIEIAPNQSFVYNAEALTAAELSELIERALQYSYNGFAKKKPTTLQIKWYDVNMQEISAPKNAGTYYVGISAGETAYYSEVSEVVQQFTITPYTIYITANNQSVVYSGAQSVILTDAANGGIFTAGNVSIELAEAFLAQQLRFDGVTLVPGSFVGAGEYTDAIRGLFSFIGEGTAENYEIEYVYGKLFITKADNEWNVEVSAPGGVYTGSAFDVTFDALFGNENALVEYFYGYKLLVDAEGKPLVDAEGNPMVDSEGNPLREEIWSTEPPVNAGSYLVRVTIADCSNYEGLVGETTLVITKRVICADGLVFEADNKTYNGQQQAWVLDPNKDKDHSDDQVHMSAANAEVQALLPYLTFCGIVHLPTEGYTNSGTYKVQAMVQITDPNYTFEGEKDDATVQTNIWTYELEVTILKRQIVVDAIDQEAQYQQGSTLGVQSGTAFLDKVTLADGTVLDFITVDFFGGDFVVYTLVTGAFDANTTYYTVSVNKEGEAVYTVADITEFAKDTDYYTRSVEHRDARESVTLSVEALAAYPAGRYALYAALSADSNYELVYNDANGFFVVTRQKVAVPELGTLIYNGEKQYPQVPAQYVGIYEYVFDPAGDYKNVGTYLVSVVLLDKVNYEWDEVIYTPLESYVNSGDIMIHFAGTGPNALSNVINEAVLKSAPYLSTHLWLSTDDWADYELYTDSDMDLILVWEIHQKTLIVQLPNAAENYVYGTENSLIEWNGALQWVSGPYAGDENTEIDLIHFGIDARYPTVGKHYATITYHGFNENYKIECQGGEVTILKKALTQQELIDGVIAHVKDYTGYELVLSPAGDGDSYYDFTVLLQKPGAFGGDVFSVIAVNTNGHIDANGKRGESFEYYVDGDSGKIYVTVTIRLNDLANYKLADGVSATFDIEGYIAQAENSWVESPIVNAGDDAILPSAQALFGNFTVTYFADAEMTQPVDKSQIEHGRSYWALFEVAEHGNYKALTGVAIFSLDYMTVNIPVLRVDTADGPQVLAGGTYVLTYDGLVHLLYRDDYVANEGIYYTVQITAGDWKNAGVYTVIYTLADEYSWSTTTSREPLVYTLEIARAALKLDLEDQSIIFGQAASTPTVLPTGLQNGEQLSDLVSVLDYIQLNYEAGDDRGTYLISWVSGAEATLEAILSNYDVTLESGVLVVARKSFSFDTVTTPDHNISGVEGSVALPQVSSLSYVYNNVERVFRVDANSVPTELVAQVSYWQNGVQLSAAPKNAGTYTVKVTLVLQDGLKADNYVIPTPAQVTLRIQKAQITITVGGQSFVYDRTDAATKLNTAASGATVTYHNVGAFDDGSAVTAITLAEGTYVDVAQYAGVIGCTHSFYTANYTISVVNGMLEITRATNTWELDDMPWAEDTVYNGNDVVLGEDYGASAVFGEVNYAFYVESNGRYIKLDYVPQNAGTYYVVASVAESNNYTQLSTGYLRLVIAKAALTLDGIVFNSASFVYDGEAHSLVATSIPEKLQVAYSANNTLTNVGSVTVSAIFTVAEEYAANYELGDEDTLTAQLSVTPVKLTVIPTSGLSSAYKEALAQLTFELDFTEYNAEFMSRYLEELAGKIKLSTAATQGSNVGEYEIKGELLEIMSNYDIDFAEDVVYLITQASNSVTLSAEDIRYLMALNITYSAQHGEVKLTFARKGSSDFTETEPRYVGTYVVRATVVGTTNYERAEQEVEFVIGKAKLSAVQSVEYVLDTATWSEVLVTEDGIPVDCTVTYLVGTASLSQTTFVANAAGSFTLVAVAGDPDNYENSDAVLLKTVYAASFDDNPELYHPKQAQKADLSTAAYQVQYRFAGQKVTPPYSIDSNAIPAIEGYVFRAWTYEGNDYDFQTGVSEDMTLYATWTIRYYTVEFYNESVSGAGVVNGVFQEGTASRGELIFSTTFAYGDALVFPSVTPLKAENEAYTYVFRHYAKTLRGEDAVAEGSLVLGEMTLYAVYTPVGKSFEVIYKIAFDGFDYTEEWTVTAKYGDPLYAALSSVKWFADDLWYVDAARKQKALGTVPCGGITLYGAYVFDVGAGDVNGDGFVTTNDITLYRQWIVGGYGVITVPAGTEWALVSDPAFDDTKLYFLERVFDVNGDISGDIRDITTARMAIVGGYGYTIAEGEAAVGVSGQGITTVDSILKSVATPNDLVLALAQGGHIQLSADIVVPLGDVITLNKDTVIYLNGYDLDFSAYTSRPIEPASNTSLVIYGTDETVKIAEYGFIRINEGVTNVSVTLYGGNYVSSMVNGSFIKPMGVGKIAIELYDVTLENTGVDYSYVIDGSYYDGNDLEIIVDGGTYTVSHGIVYGNHNTAIVRNATFNVTFMGIEGSGDDSALPEDAAMTLVENCTITLNSPVYDDMNACVIVGWGGQMTVKNCTLTSNAHVASVLSKPASKITLEDCTLTATDPSYDALYFHENVGTIEQINCTNQ